jgi:hypothetical protein
MNTLDKQALSCAAARQKSGRKLQRIRSQKPTSEFACRYTMLKSKKSFMGIPTLDPVKSFKKQAASMGKVARGEDMSSRAMKGIMRTGVLGETDPRARAVRMGAKAKAKAEAKASRWAPEAQEIVRTGVSERAERLKGLKRAKREASERKEGESDEDYKARLAAVKEETNKEMIKEKIVFFGRSAPIWQALVFLVIAGLEKVLHHIVPIFEVPGIKALSPLKFLKKFLTVKWKYAGATFHGKKLAFHCTFTEFWKFFALELVKSIGTVFIYNIYHHCKNSMLMEHFVSRSALARPPLVRCSHAYPPPCSRARPPPAARQPPRLGGSDVGTRRRRPKAGGFRCLPRGRSDEARQVHLENFSSRGADDAGCVSDPLFALRRRLLP